MHINLYIDRQYASVQSRVKDILTGAHNGSNRYKKNINANKMLIMRNNDLYLTQGNAMGERFVIRFQNK